MTTQAWRRASDLGRVGLAAAAVAGALFERDRRCAAALATSIAAAHGVSAILKRELPELRPDAADTEGFPSAHTAEAVAAAVSLTRRYGWKIGLPAGAVAAVVGVCRVKARRHYWHDVVAGAAIGAAMGWTITAVACDA